VGGGAGVEGDAGRVGEAGGGPQVPVGPRLARVVGDVEVALAGDVVLVDQDDVAGIGRVRGQARDVPAPQGVDARACLRVVHDTTRHARALGRCSRQDQQAAQAEAERRGPQFVHGHCSLPLPVDGQPDLRTGAPSIGDDPEAFPGSYDLP
jgi:hypothetical protein